MTQPERTRLINRFMREGGYQSYLEIGFLDDGAVPSQNFTQVDAFYKRGVDPAYNAETSDAFFEALQQRRPGYRYDLIFIDGLHYMQQAYRDIINSLNTLAHHGTILVNDTNPQDYWQQHVPRKQVDWTGDVWRAVLKARQACPHHICYTLPKETGITVFQHPPAHDPGPPDRTIERFDPHTLSWDSFCSNRTKILNLRKTGMDGT